MRRLTYIAAAIIAGLALLVPVLNLWIPPESPFHIPDYLVLLLGRYLCFAILALALDLAWGYCGILSLGHGAFFALGGYAMGMYLMRQIGTRGVYAHPALPDFMVFLNWKELPWYWYGFDMFWFACVMVMVVPGLLVLGALFVCVTLFLPKSIVGTLAVWAAKRPARKKAPPVVTPAAEAAE